jgi:hypothetical protein
VSLLYTSNQVRPFAISATNNLITLELKQPFWIAQGKGYKHKFTIYKTLTEMITSPNAVFIPGAHLFLSLWHIMQVTGIQDARAPEKFYT